MKKISLESQNKAGLIKFGMNQAYLHYDITPERIKRMRKIPISSGAAYGKMKSKYFNPVYFYPEGVTLERNEIGHDRDYRYILRESKKN